MNTKELELILEGKSKKSTTGQVFTIVKCLSIFTWCVGKFVVKNTPTVLGVAWQVKKEISNEIAQGIHEYKQEQRQLALDEKIKALTLPNKNHNLEKK
jgi:hypothetical protein